MWIVSLFVLVTGFLLTSTDCYFDPCNADANNSMRLPDISKSRRRRAATSQTELLWKHGVVPYKISDDFNGKEELIIRKALQHWEERTCLSFIQRTTEKEYVFFQRKPECGCVSYVGRMGENQSQGINLSDKCVTFGAVLHEIGHLVGFWHEFTRPDRDQHLTIITRNIQIGKMVNFVKKSPTEVNSFGVEYDFESIMQYAKNAFSKNSFDNTIIPKKLVNINPVAHRGEISSLDAVQTKLLYECPVCSKTFTESHRTIVLVAINTTNAPTSCQWRIFSPAGHTIQLHFSRTDFELPCADSYLDIYDGKHDSAPLLERYCDGNRPPSYLQFLSQNLLIKYHVTKERNQKIRMKISYNVHCGGHLKSNEGILNSPNYPNAYKTNQFCEWNITVNENSTIAFNFNLLRIEKSKNCVKDYVEIIDNALGKSLGRFCKLRHVKLLTTSSNKATVRFHSNDNKVKDGFALSYFSEIDECAINNGNCSHECINTIGGYKCTCNTGYQWNAAIRECESTCVKTHNIKPGHTKVIASPNYPRYYPNNRSCTWRLVGLPTYKIYLTFKVFNLAHAQTCDEKSDRVKILEESQGIKKHIMSLCGNLVTPIELTSTDQVMTVQFRSNDDVTSQGFYAEVQLDKNECEINDGGCEHICKNTLKSFQCECRPGYKLNADGHTCEPGNCTVSSTKNEGLISSPDFPNLYPGNNLCTWTLKTLPGHKYLIDTLLPQKDWNPFGVCPISLQKLSGSTWITDQNICLQQLQKKSIESANHITRLKFVSKPNTHGYKFQLMYRTKCGGHLKAKKTTQSIFSHVDYLLGENYPANQSCSWLITTSKRRRISINFKTFNMEHEPCVFDYVSLYDGEFTESPLIAKLCGSKLEETVYTSSQNTMLIKFITDANFHGDGFELRYKKIRFGVKVKKNDISVPVRRTRDSFMFGVDIPNKNGPKLV